jgi:malonate decarboxylase epsilon subunit
MSLAFLFPGQGSQRPGMLHALPNHPAISQTLEEASAELGYDVKELDSESSLLSTVSVQLALFVVGVAVARALKQEEIRPAAVAGLSVGAFAAAVTCETLRFSDGLRLVKQRAELMAGLYPQGYGLAAIIGLSEPQVADLVARTYTDEAPIFVSNINAPRQIIIAGAIAGMETVLAAARAQGARKAERLRVSVPSHCPLLQPVAEALQQSLHALSLQRPAIPYVGNVRARVLRGAEAIADDLAMNVALGVRWHDATTVLAELGCALFLEICPGHVLTDLALEALPQVRSIALDKISLSYAKQLSKHYVCD